MSAPQQTSDAGEPSHLSLLRRGPKEKARYPVSKLLAIAATLKAVLIAASFTLARGDMLSVILISALFNLIHLGAKPPSERVQRDSMVASRSNDR
jgi:hypothetical protein